MKVIHYCGTFSKLSETFIYDVIVELDRAKIINKVVTNKIIKHSERKFADIILLKRSISHLILKNIKKCLNLANLCKYDPALEVIRSRQDALLKVFLQEKPDIVHAHFGAQGVVVLPVIMKLGIPLIVSFHGYDAFRLPNERGWTEKYQSLFKEAKIITVVSEMMRNHLISLGCASEKIHLIHVGKRMADYPFKANVSKPIRNFISVGRLSEKKGFKDCIQAFQLLSSKYPDLTLKIIGTGSQESELKKLIANDKGIEGITFLGAMSHEETKKCIVEADAFVLCSKLGVNGDKEGIPVVLMEAQALGIPCVSTDHSGIPEVIPESNHWLLAKEGDALDIAQKIEYLITSPVEKLNQTILVSRKKIESEFNLEIEAAKVKSLYCSMINE
jgi:colanic acid/amylovoran biosynthesis glycosyltransferase